MSVRYAIYLAPPPDSALWRFGSRVLGRDAATGEDLPGYAPAGHTPEPWRELTAEPRRYGFHATIKAPFRLADGCTPAEFETAVAALAGSVEAFDLGPLAVAPLTFAGGAFVALRPLAPPPQLKALEALAVRELDRFRAPLSAAELARRRPERLTARQRDLLSAWGYPYVLDEFRLHFTLSGACTSADALAATLAEEFSRCGAEGGFVVDALVLFAQNDDEDFRILRRFELRAAR